MPQGPLVPDRDSDLVRRTTGRRVIHVGCTDWPFTQEKLVEGELLHQKLLASSEAVFGIDVDAAGLDLLAGRLGGAYRVLDVGSGPADIDDLVGFRPEVLLAADVIEHVGDAESFMCGLSALARATEASSIVISTPNALGVRASVNNLAGWEMMHPDHVAVHTPCTLTTLAARAGLEPCSWSYYTVHIGATPARRSVDAVIRTLARARVGYADGMIACFEPRDPRV